MLNSILTNVETSLRWTVFLPKTLQSVSGRP